MVTMKRKPYQFGFILFLIAFVTAGIVLEWFVPLRWELDLLIAWNIAAFFLMGFDKFQAANRGGRIPEKVFYVVTILGGTIGTLLGMHTFRHKTRKTSFQMVIALLILIQLGLAAWYFNLI